jgi:hypothetical protein
MPNPSYLLLSIESNASPYRVSVLLVLMGHRVDRMRAEHLRIGRSELILLRSQGSVLDFLSASVLLGDGSDGSEVLIALHDPKQSSEEANNQTLPISASSSFRSAPASISAGTDSHR